MDEKQKKLAASMAARWNELKQMDFPDPPPCSKCGRLIFCGVNKLCSDKECPKKTTKLVKK